MEDITCQTLTWMANQSFKNTLINLHMIYIYTIKIYRNVYKVKLIAFIYLHGWYRYSHKHNQV